MPGFTCCVPGCYNNSHRDRELRFYTFPKDTTQREIWLKNISRAGVSGCFSTFQPTTGHRVCSVHFPGGRKTYTVRVPTLFPLRGIGPDGEYLGPVNPAAQGDGSCFTAVVSSSTDLAGGDDPPADAAAAAQQQTVQYYSVVSNPLDHAYSLTTGTTSAELLRKLNEQRDIIALMEVKMKEMKATIRQLRVNEAKLQEEVRERDRLLSAGAAVKKM
ncbi:unnamed protein product [Oncorhynchus mykiss]|uniref:THAP domain-containing protein 11 n=1 Tax=Oncorhynchus mykiss TaxID=8022 RepID=A0A060WBJ7_ONCMY|nr:unnamed protein product [Oncorhynchus mykiss]